MPMPELDSIRLECQQLHLLHTQPSSDPLPAARRPEPDQPRMQVRLRRYQWSLHLLLQLLVSSQRDHDHHTQQHGHEPEQLLLRAED